MELQHNITFRKKDKGWQYIISYKIDKIGVWKQKSKQGFTSKLEAKKAADKMLDGLKEELSNNLSLNSDFSNITLREFYNIYIANSQHRLTASTLNNFKYTIKAFDEIVDIELRKIKTQDIQRCVNALYNAGKKQATIETRLAYIQILFNSAVKEYNIILRSPGDSVKLKTIPWKLSLQISLAKHIVLPIIGIIIVLNFTTLNAFVGRVISLPVKANSVVEATVPLLNAVFLLLSGFVE